MKQINLRNCTYILFYISIYSLSGCQSPSKPTFISTVPSITRQENTPTHTLTITLTPTQTPTNTITNTYTSTFTETPAYNVPGYYYIAKCIYFTPSGLTGNIKATFCINSVNVNADFTMKFNVYWSISAIHYGWGDVIISKPSDTNNYNMFIEDNLKNKYQHIGVGGCAATDITWTNTGDCNGWFLFPAAKPGVASFRFYDMDNMVYVENIVLLHGDYPTLTRTPKPTLGSYNSPGTYWIYKCTFFIPQSNFPGASDVTLCLNTVVINKEYEMRFNVNWKINYGSVNNWKKPSDANNYYIILEDNMDNSYQHIYTGGCAGQETEIVHFGTSGDCNGWFQFPQAKSGATSLRFIDLANHAAIENIILLPK